jgi:myosin heavy subunit
MKKADADLATDLTNIGFQTTATAAKATLDTDKAKLADLNKQKKTLEQEQKISETGKKNLEAQKTKKEAGKKKNEDNIDNLKKEIKAHEKEIDTIDKDIKEKEAKKKDKIEQRTNLQNSLKSEKDKPEKEKQEKDNLKKDKYKNITQDITEILNRKKDEKINLSQVEGKQIQIEKVKILFGDVDKGKKEPYLQNFINSVVSGSHHRQRIERGYIFYLPVEYYQKLQSTFPAMDSIQKTITGNVNNII